MSSTPASSPHIVQGSPSIPSVPTIRDKSQSALTTPPLSDADADIPALEPTIAPAVAKVLEEFRRLKEGTHSRREPWLKISLGEEEWASVQQRLGKDDILWGYVEDKLRYVTSSGVVYGSSC